jgi:hypothetical protein
MAASATFALKAGQWFRRSRLFMVSPVHGDYRRCQAEIPLMVLFRFPEPAQTFVRCAASPTIVSPSGKAPAMEVLPSSDISEN